MFGPSLKKHLREFQRYIRNHQYEKGEGTIYFPAARATAAGVYTHWITGQESDIREDHNILPDEGLNHMLGVTLKGVTPITSWYAMLHSGTGTPTAALTAANYDATLSEITSAAEGYSEATRVLWVGDAVDTVNTEVVNAAAPCTFTIASATSLGINGAGLVSVSTKGSTSGILISAGKFSATRTFVAADEFNLKYKVDLDAV
jgi:hypothetical protein